MGEPGEPVLATPLPPESAATAVDSAPVVSAAAGAGAAAAVAGDADGGGVRGVGGAGGGAGAGAGARAAAIAAGDDAGLPGAATAEGGDLVPADGDVGRREAEPGVGATPAWGRTG